MFNDPPLMISKPSRLGVFKGFGEFLFKYFPGIARELELLEYHDSPESYLGKSSLNSFLWSSLFSILIMLLVFMLQKDALMAILVGSLVGGIVFLLFLGVFLVYPGIILRKLAEDIDSQLVYALNDLTMQVTAGASLMEGIRRIARSHYGPVSEQFGKVIERTISGDNLEDALTYVAKRNQSEFLRRAFWQLATVTQTGSSIEHSLRDLLESLREYQANRIRKYSQVLNFYILIYFMLAVVVPSLSVLLLTIISTFMSGGIKIGNLSISIDVASIVLSLLYVVGQFIVIEYIRVKRPLV